MIKSAPSSSGLGHDPLKVETGVRVSVGLLLGGVNMKRGFTRILLINAEILAS